MDTLKRLVGKREYRKIEMKEVIMEHPDYGEVNRLLVELKAACRQYVQINNRRLPYIRFWKTGGVDKDFERISDQLEEVVEILKNSNKIIVLNKTMDFPVIKNYHLSNLRINARLRMVLAILFPVGGPIYLIAAYRHRLLYQEMYTTAKVCDELINII